LTDDLMSVRIFSNHACELGEAPLWHSDRFSLLWLDILEKKLYEKKFASPNSTYDTKWSLPEHASVIVRDSLRVDLIWMVTNKSFGTFDLSKGTYSPVLSLPIKSSFRGNDGSVAPDGSFWFGSMQWEPDGTNGSIYSIPPSLKIVDHDIKIGIPNTFQWSPDGKHLYISDSYKGMIFRYEISGGFLDRRSRFIFSDLGSSPATPDGGAIDQNGHLWTALWGGHRLVLFSQSSEIITKLDVPAPQPSSCCFGGPENRHLFITSARTDMTPAEVSKYPCSGYVFVSELDNSGAPIRPYRCDAQC
jgi:sugar lactone lactonase YvrE